MGTPVSVPGELVESVAHPPLAGAGRERVALPIQSCARRAAPDEQRARLLRHAQPRDYEPLEILALDVGDRLGDGLVPRAREGVLASGRAMRTMKRFEARSARPRPR